MNAIYGQVSCLLTVTTKVINRCERKNTCNVKANNNNFGDPCVGIFKFLSIDYQCIEVTPSSQSKL